MRRELPETSVWFVERGRFVEARQYYGDHHGRLLDDLLPEHNVSIESTSVGEALRDLFSRSFSRRTTLFG